MSQTAFHIQYGDQETKKIHKDEPIITKSLTSLFEWVYKIIIHTADLTEDIHIYALLCPLNSSQESCNGVRLTPPTKEIKPKKIILHLEAHAVHVIVPFLENQINSITLLLDCNENMRIQQIIGKICEQKEPMKN